MTDVHSKATRSKNMRAIGTRDTAIEKRLSGLGSLDVAPLSLPFHRHSNAGHGRPATGHAHPKWGP